MHFGLPSLIRVSFGQWPFAAIDYSTVKWKEIMFSLEFRDLGGKPTKMSP
jgi:hypothetical protein